MPPIGVIGGFLTVVAVVVGAIFVTRSTISKETVAQLEKLVDAQGTRIQFLVNENESLKLRVEALEQTKTELFEQVKSIPAFALMTSEMVVMSQRMEKVLEAIVVLTDRLERRDRP